MRLHPKLTLEYNHGYSEPFCIYIKGSDNDKDIPLGSYPCKNLQVAIEAFKVAWNVHASTMAFYKNLQSLSEKVKKDAD